MRYRTTLYIDVWQDNKEEALKEIENIIKDIPNSFIGGTTELPHGSNISFTKENQVSND